MILPRRIGFALDGISRAARTVAHRTSPLYHEPRYHAVERQSVIKSALGEFDEILRRTGRLFRIEFGFHIALLRTDNSVCHYILLIFPHVVPLSAGRNRNLSGGRRGLNLSRPLQRPGTARTAGRERKCGNPDGCRTDCKYYLSDFHSGGITFLRQHPLRVRPEQRE